jgi:pimeloyl-ACP methyl ester carboxylesterase
MKSNGIILSTVLSFCFFTPGVLPAADNSRPPVTMTRVNGIDIAYQELGAGDPLVMIMGYGGSMDLWSPRLLTLLSASHRILIFDNRGMGRSTADGQEYSIPLFADDTLGLMDALGIRKATILGWSMGAETAQELAISQPDRVLGLVLISGSPGGKEQANPDPSVLKQLTDNSGSPFMRGLRLIRLLFPDAWLKSHPFWDYFPIHATMNPHERSRKQLQAMMEWGGSWSRLGSITCPALIITGDQDVILPAENSVKLAAGIHRSELIRFPDAGHGVMFQHADSIAKDVDELITRERGW